jgi:hypothetical protein
VAAASVAAAVALLAILIANGVPVSRPPGDLGATSTPYAPPFSDAPEVLTVADCPVGGGTPGQRDVEMVATIGGRQTDVSARWLTYLPSARTLLWSGSQPGVMASVSLFGDDAGSWAMESDATVAAAVVVTPAGTALATIGDPSHVSLVPLPRHDSMSIAEATRVDLRALDLSQVDAIGAGRGEIVMIDGGRRLVRARIGVAGVASACQVRAEADETFRAAAMRSQDGHVFVFVADGEGARIRELDAQGTLVAHYGLPDALRRVQAMAFAPSAHPYDDPATEHLYLLTAARPQPVIQVVALEPSTPVAGPDVPVPEHVRTTSTAEWVPPSADPTGVAFDAARGAILVTDSEIDELFPAQAMNTWIVSADGAQQQALAFFPSTEPTDISVDHHLQRVFISDDRADVIHVWRPGADGVLGTSDDATYAIATDTFGSRDPEGLAYGQGSLFICDGAGRMIYRVMPGPNGQFDGIHPRSDDEVRAFGVRRLGLLDPEGIAYHADRGTLFVVDRNEAGPVLEITTSGDLVRRYDLTGLGLLSPAGVAVGPSSDDPARTSLFLVDRGVDNARDPNESDGQLVELRLPDD